MHHVPGTVVGTGNMRMKNHVSCAHSHYMLEEKVM